MTTLDAILLVVMFAPAAVAGYFCGRDDADYLELEKPPMPTTPLAAMSPDVAKYVRSHMAAGGLVYRMTPGAGYEGELTDRTACTFLLKTDGSGVPCALLLECARGESIDDAAEFLCQQINFAYRPSDEMADLGFAPADGTVVVITFFTGLDTIDSLYLRNEVMKTSKHSEYMGNASEQPPGFWINR